MTSLIESHIVANIVLYKILNSLIRPMALSTCTRTWAIFVIIMSLAGIYGDNKEEGRSTPNSVASKINLVFGYSFLNTSGIYFFTICHGGKRSMALRL